MIHEEKVEYLKENFSSKWNQAWHDADVEASKAQPAICVCGALATGFHERHCRRFQRKVAGIAVKKLSHLWKPEAKRLRDQAKKEAKCQVN